MDKLIYTAFNTVNNIYDNRSVRGSKSLKYFSTGLSTRPWRKISGHSVFRKHSDPANTGYGCTG